MLQERNNIKILSFFIFMILPGSYDKSAVSHYPMIFSLSMIISVLSYYFKFLNFKGAAAVFLLAFVILGLGGFSWTVPILVFFIFSSLLSGIGRTNKKITGQPLEKHSPRNHLQVFANGGFGGILVIINFFFPSQLFYFCFVSSVAAVCADTWSTEIGTKINTKTVDILTFKIVEQGISGGISLAGSIAGAAGAAVIALSSIFWLNVKNFYYIFFIIFAGIIGNLFDSILGSSMQAKYKCSICSLIVEKPYHCSHSAVLTKGFKWMNNDVVNFATAVIGGLFGFLFLEIF